MTRTIPALLIVAACLRAAPIAADSVRGERLFEKLACLKCHSINGQGGRVGPDLGRRIGRNFTPASLAATMWNHAPLMREAMRARNIAAGDLNEQAAADLYAYFYSARFFDKPGDAGRGKRLFEAKHCAECHGMTETKVPAAKPITQWETSGQPIALAGAMWNHGANMREEFARRKLKWPELTSQDLTDLLVFIRNRPETRNAIQRVEFTAGASGEAFFQSRGCTACHMGQLTLTAGRLKSRTLVDIAASMWNHQPRMAQTPPKLTPDEMREITSYLWAAQFFEDAGDVAAGRRVYASKKCFVCHSDPNSGAPKLPGRQSSGITMVSGLWRHGPAMLEEMRAKQIPWPRFEGSQMSDLIAYLNSTKKTSHE